MADSTSVNNHDTEQLSHRVDNLTSTIDRLSKSFEDYMSYQQTTPPVPTPPPVYSTKDRSEAYVQKVPHTTEKSVHHRRAAETEANDDFTTDFSQDENKDRGNWSGRLDFLLACLGYAVGLGNVWRFPYLCYKNGGAVFFIPYVIMLVFVGMPIFFLELSLGQFTSSSPLTCWEMARIFKGVGVAMCVISSLVAIYYNVIIAWSFFYLFASFRKTPPWSSCDPEWASDWCEYNLRTETRDNFTVSSCMNPNPNGTEWYAASDGVCYELTGLHLNSYGKFQNNTPIGIFDQLTASKNNLKPVLASEEYLNAHVLGTSYSDQFEDMGGIRWQLALCLLLAWTIVALCLIKGVKSSGKVVYFTALFPYVVLVILLVRGLLLDGYGTGIDFYIAQVKFEKLKEAQVWKDAAVQIFFSLSASFGGLIALSSYNRFHNDCLRDSLIVSIGNCLTSFFAGFVIFSYIGFLAEKNGVPVDELAKSGSTLAFVIYPAAVIEMPISTLWAILFFIMLISLGLDSEFALVETVTTSLMDQFPSLRKRKALVIIVTCIIFFLLGLTMTTDGGVYMLEIMDLYSGGWNVLLVALCECMCVAYIYGFFRYRKDVDIMIARTCCGKGFSCGCSMWWGLMWYFFTPCGVLFIMVFSWVDYERPTLGDYVYPRSAEALGWLMTLAGVCSIVVTPIVLIIMQCARGEDILDLFRPTRYWGPALPKHRKLMGRYLNPDKFEVDPWNVQHTVQSNQLPTGYVQTEDYGYTNPDLETGKTVF